MGPDNLVLGQTSCEIPLSKEPSKNLPDGDAGSLDGWRISQDLRTPWTPDDRQRIRVTTAGHVCSVDLELGLARRQEVVCWGLPGVNFVGVDNNLSYTQPSVRRQRVPRSCPRLPQDFKPHATTKYSKHVLQSRISQEVVASKSSIAKLP